MVIKLGQAEECGKTRVMWQLCTPPGSWHGCGASLL